MASTASSTLDFFPSSSNNFVIFAGLLGEGSYLVLLVKTVLLWWTNGQAAKRSKLRTSLESNNLFIEIFLGEKFIGFAQSFKHACKLCGAEKQLLCNSLRSLCVILKELNCRPDAPGMDWFWTVFLKPTTFLSLNGTIWLQYWWQELCFASWPYLLQKK